MGWLSQAREELGKDQKKPPTEDEVIPAALPQYIRMLNLNRISAFNRGDRKQLTLIDLETVSKRQYHKILAGFKAAVEKAQSRTASLTTASRWEDPEGEGALAGFSESDNNTFNGRTRYFSRFSQADQRYLMARSKSGKMVRVLIVADAPEPGETAEDAVARAFKVDGVRAKKLLDNALQSARECLARRDFGDAKNLPPVNTWIARELLLKRPPVFQARLLAILSIDKAWAVLLDSGILGENPLSVPEASARMKLTEKQYYTSRSNGYADIRPYLNPGTGIEDLPRIDAVTALGLLPKPVFDKLIAPLTPLRQEALRYVTALGNHGRHGNRETAAQREFKKSMNNNTTKARVALGGDDRIESILIRAFLKMPQPDPDEDCS